MTQGTWGWKLKDDLVLFSPGVIRQQHISGSQDGAVEELKDKASVHVSLPSRAAEVCRIRVEVRRRRRCRWGRERSSGSVLTERASQTWRMCCVPVCRPRAAAQLLNSTWRFMIKAWKKTCSCSTTALKKSSVLQHKPTEAERWMIY